MNKPFVFKFLFPKITAILFSFVSICVNSWLNSYKFLKSLLSHLDSIYYYLKYFPFTTRCEKRNKGRRGFVSIQIDGLSHKDLLYALERGYMPKVKKYLRQEEGLSVIRYPSGLPSCTPFAVAGIMFGNNESIPAFRWYEKKEGRIISCSSPESIQYVRQKIKSPGTLKGGSSHANLFDGDADRVSLTPTTKPALSSVLDKIGIGILFWIFLLHPFRILRVIFASALEFFVEIYDRYISRNRSTVHEGFFPFIRVFANVILREIQTLAVLLDIYIGIPFIYTTYSGYDELSHHYGPRSKPSLETLKHIDGRIGEIKRMIKRFARSSYDLIILSDHGLTPSNSFLALYGKPLGEILSEGIRRSERLSVHSGLVDSPGGEKLLPSEIRNRGKKAGGPVVSLRANGFISRGFLKKLADMFESSFRIFPEGYFVDGDYDIVVTYSSSLAHIYFSRYKRKLYYEEVEANYRYLIYFLLNHEGIGVLFSVLSDGRGVITLGKKGVGVIDRGEFKLLEGANPLYGYGPIEEIAPPIERMVKFKNSGDLVLFGAYDGEYVVSFNDEVGAHGSLGGEQFYPFIILPKHCLSDRVEIREPRDIYFKVFSRYNNNSG